MRTVQAGVSTSPSRSSTAWAIGGFLLALLVAGCGGSDSSTAPQGLAPEGPPTDLRIETGGTAIAPGTSRQLSAVATYGNGASANVTESVTWNTSDGAILTITNTSGSKGMATRLTEASVEVTATLDSLSASLDVCVWSTVIATGLRFDGDVGGTGTGFAIGHLAGDATAVYWAAFDASAGNTGGSIGRALKAGGPATTLASGLGGINDIASDGSYVYWTEFELGGGNGSVKRVPVGGGSVEVLATGTPAGSIYDVFFPGGIAVDASYVYWGEYVGGGAIRRVPKAGGTVTDFARGDGFGPTALQIYSGYLYGVDNNTGVAGRVAVGGGSAEVLATGLNNPSEASVDAQGLYSAELTGGTGRIVRVPLTGGAVAAVASNLDNPRSVAAQGGSLYYPGIDDSGATPVTGVWKAATDGSTHDITVSTSGTSGGFDPSSLTTDASYIFFVDAEWSTPGAARVLRAPRE